MNCGTQPKSTFEDLGRNLDARFGSAFVNAEEELRKVISYLNDEVVPQVRRDSTEALRLAAQKLAQLAEYLERRNSGL
jgi:hypothetical protein